jgi:hypothetical protein
LSEERGNLSYEDSSIKENRVDVELESLDSESERGSLPEN